MEFAFCNSLVTDTPMKRGIIALFLLVGIAACVLTLFRDQIFASGFDGLAETQLETRVSLYVSSRESDDWTVLYDMVDPEQRKVVDKIHFLQVFASGVLRINEIATVSSDIDAASQTAKTKMKTIGELVVERLPRKYRKSLQVADKSKLRRESDLDLDWVWRDGEWYYLLEREFVTGRDKEGNELRPLGNKDDKGNK